MQLDLCESVWLLFFNNKTPTDENKKTTRIKIAFKRAKMLILRSAKPGVY